jgi:hypothetical protein
MSSRPEGRLSAARSAGILATSRPTHIAEINASFNVKGQPIVNTPREVIDTFLST